MKVVEARMSREPDQSAIRVKSELRPLFDRRCLDGDVLDNQSRSFHLKPSCCRRLSLQAPARVH